MKSAAANTQGGRATTSTSRSTRAVRPSSAAFNRKKDREARAGEEKPEKKAFIRAVRDLEKPGLLASRGTRPWRDMGDGRVSPVGGSPHVPCPYRCQLRLTRTKKDAMSIKCGLSDAEKTVRSRWERMEGLGRCITEAIEQAIKATGEDEQAIADLPFNRAEARSALACAAATVVGKPKAPDDAWLSAHPDLTEKCLFVQYDDAEIEKFIDEVRIAIDPKRWFELYE